ncbi:MAG: hypothetical protein F8N39_14120 [Clostridiaceae bacterium]|nr:hypothetical protein [Clostridiaceae bacterium]
MLLMKFSKNKSTRTTLRDGVPRTSTGTMELALACGLMVCLWTSETAAATCPSYPPVLNLGGTVVYSDSKGSQVDKTAESRNNDAQAPVIDFLKYELTSIEGAPAWNKIENLSADCANTLLAEWAEAGALGTTLEADGSFSHQGGINRQILMRSLAIVALKLQQSGKILGPRVVPWLGHFVHENNASWRKNTLRSNLYYWAGATSAIYAILSKDKDALDFQNETWSYAMSAIRDDGYLDSELVRGTRALVYHAYALSALLTLREARQAIGLPSLNAEHAQLKRLADRIGAALCHPEAMSTLADVGQQEMPGEWGYREIEAFGTDLLSPDWKNCGVTVKNFFDINNGGDQQKNITIFLPKNLADH